MGIWYTAALGGKAPWIVFEKADIETAVNGIAFGSFIASEQTCIASTRIIVQNTILEEDLRNLKVKAEGIRDSMGPPSNPESSIGSLISQKQWRKVEGLVERLWQMRPRCELARWI